MTKRWAVAVLATACFVLSACGSSGGGAAAPAGGSPDRAATLGAEAALDVFVCSVPAIWTYNQCVRGADTTGLSYFWAFGDLRHVGIAGGGR